MLDTKVLTGIITIVLSFFAMSLFSRKNHLPVEDRNVLITGGSQGMGKAVAILLSSMGANVGIVARDVPKLEAALVEIIAAAKDKSKQKFTMVSADLTDAVKAKWAVEEVEKALGTTDILWTCAGGAYPDFFKDTDPEVMVQQMNMNYFSTAYVAHAVLNSMVANPPPLNSPQRKLVFTSSLVTFAPIIGYTTYAGTKAAVRALADCLRQECILYDISVSCCFPGNIYTPGFDTEMLTKPEICTIVEGKHDGHTPEAVAKVCLKGLERGDVLVMDSFTGKIARGGMWGNTPKSNFLVDTAASWLSDIVWAFLGPQMDGMVRKYKKEHGVPPKRAS